MGQHSYTGYTRAGIAVGIAYFFVLAAVVQAADPIDAQVQAEVNRQKIAALSLIIIRDGKTIREQKYIFSQIGVNTHRTTESSVQIGAIRNIFTAGAILLLVNDEAISLDDPLTKFFPVAPADLKAVTLRNLLTHTSGLKNVRVSSGLPHGTAAETILRKAGDAPLTFAPGTTWFASKTDYLLLESIIEKVSGKRYVDFLTQRLFVPLRLATARVDDAGDFRMLVEFQDLAKWMEALEAGTLFPKSLWEQIGCPLAIREKQPCPDGLGGETHIVKGHPVITYAETGPSFTVRITRWPAENLTVMMRAEKEGADLGGLTETVASLALPHGKQSPVDSADSASATALVRKVILQLTEAQLDKNLFAPEMWEEVKTFADPKRARQIKQLGPLKSATLLGQKTALGERLYQYRLIFPRARLRCLLTLDAQNRIAGLLLSEGG